MENILSSHAANGGGITEKLLQENNVEDYYLLDSKFDRREGKKITFEDVGDFRDCEVLLCCENVFSEIRGIASAVFPKQNIIDVCHWRTAFELSKYKNRDQRFAMLTSCCREIYENGVEGSVAEAGVYQGGFAKYINGLFPDREMYLFDTFEGFQESDRSIDVAEGYSDGLGDWGDTSVNRVLDVMPYRNQCIVKKGFFPDTAADLPEDIKFCFVSLDMDLYQPIYEGLKFFYPKLSSGGYIFVHDCGDTHYLGAKKALVNFCREYGVGYTILVDNEGTAVITKAMVPEKE
jgi:O-methyltransferase